MAGTIVAYFSTGTGVPSVAPDVPAGEWAFYQDLATGDYYRWNLLTTAWEVPSSTVDAGAVHLSPGSPESGDIEITGSITCASVTATADINTSTNATVAGNLNTRQLSGQPAYPTTFVPNDSGEAGTGATLAADGGSYAPNSLHGKVVLVVGTGSSAGHLGDVLLPATASVPDSLCGRFFGKDANSTALLPYCVDKSDGTGHELWCVNAPVDGETYHFGYHFFGA